MSMNRGMRRHEIDQLAQKCLRERKFIKAYGEYFTPHEFLEGARGKWVFRTDLTLIDPFLVIENGRRKLKENSDKQQKFERKVHDYFQRLSNPK